MLIISIDFDIVTFLKMVLQKRGTKGERLKKRSDSSKRGRKVGLLMGEDVSEVRPLSD